MDYNSMIKKFGWLMHRKNFEARVLLFFFISKARVLLMCYRPPHLAMK